MGKRAWLRSLAVLACLASSACANSPNHATANPDASSSRNPSVTPSSANTHPGEVETDTGQAGPTAVTVSDPAGDLVSASEDADWFEDATPAPQQAGGDIIGIGLRHTATEILVRVRFADLRPRSRGKPYPISRVGTTITTDTGIDRNVELWIRNQDPTIPPITMSSNGEPVSCPLKHTIDVDKGIATEGIPRDCLGHPQWVRIGLNCLTFEADNTMTLDLALLDGYDSAHEDDLSPPIHEP